jgi:Microtubule binding
MQAVEEAEHLRAELRRESLLRKRAHNELRELKGNIRVLCRVRPATAGAVNEHRAGSDSADMALSPHDEFTVLLNTVSKYVPYCQQ